MKGRTQRALARSVIIFASAVMLLVAIYKAAWLLLGAITSGVWPGSVFDAANLLEGPAYLVSAATAWTWPWIAEIVGLLSLAVILMRFNPWIASPFQRGLALDYAFIVAANAVFFTTVLLRRFETKDI